MLSFAFVAPLLRFVPADFINPLIALVGEREQGKSTLAIAVASAFAGDASSTNGGGYSFDVTRGAVDGMMAECGDSLLFIDEGDLAGNDVREQAKLLRHMVMKLSQSAARRRIDTIGPTAETRVALIPTSTEAGRALQTRLLSLWVGGESGFKVFETVPKGYTSEEHAVRTLRQYSCASFGVAGRLFVENITTNIREDEVGFRQMLCRKLDLALSKFSDPGSARINKTGALTAVAGHLAEKWGVFPPGMRTLTLRNIFMSEQSSARAHFAASFDMDKLIGRMWFALRALRNHWTSSNSGPLRAS